MKEQLSLKQMILNEIENHPRGFSNELSEIAGYSNGGNLKKVLNDEKKEFDKFNGLIELLKFLWKDQYIEMMIKYSTEVDPNKKTARTMLEFLVTARKFEAFNNLLARMDECSNKESKEYAKLYRMQYKYELASTMDEFNTLIKEINQLHLNLDELNIYKNFLMSYCFGLKKDYNTVKFLLMGIEDRIDLIENEYIKEKYTIRYNEIMAYNNLYIYNDPDAARKCADKILSSNVPVAFMGYSYYIKGFSYLFTSFGKTMEYLNKSLDMYKKINRFNEVEDLLEKIEFTKVYWDKFTEEKCSYLKNNLFLKIKKGINVEYELKKSQEQIECELYLYLEGINNKDNKKLKLSLIKLIKGNEMFLANLPKIELIKNGEDEEVMEEMFA